MASNTKDETYDNFIDDDIVNESHNVETDTNQQDTLPLPQNPPSLPPDTLRRSKRTIQKPALWILNCDRCTHTIVIMQYIIITGYSCMSTTYFCNIGDVTCACVCKHMIGLFSNRYFTVLAGCFSGLGENTAWLLSPRELTAEQLEEYYSTAQEADTGIWRHAMQSQASSVLIYSPDTDVYNIGLSFTKQRHTTTYIVQINVPHADETRYININNLQTAMLLLKYCA